jgi:hypothetical protein
MDITSSIIRKLQNKTLRFYGHTERMEKGLQKNMLNSPLRKKLKKKVTLSL